MLALIHFHSCPATPFISFSSFPPSRRLFCSSSTSFPYSLLHQNQPKQKQQDQQQTEHHHHHHHQQHFDEDYAIGDCLVFDESAFEDGTDPFLPTEYKTNSVGRNRKKDLNEIEPENLVPDKWKEVAAELTATKKEKRKMAHQLKFGTKLLRRKKLSMPDIEEYRAFRETKLAQLRPVVLDNPKRFALEKETGAVPLEPEGRVVPKNPRAEVGEGSLEDISDFFNSEYHVPWETNDDKKPNGPRKLFTKEEKALLNKRIPNLAEATSSKWLPLQTLAASGEFYLVKELLKHNVDINETDNNGLTALHKAILCKKQAIINYLLRESANPFVRDKDGATLLHYAVQTSSSQTIKILLLYNVDINLPDDDGWTPLHLAVQTQRTDIVRLLLIKGADRTLRNRDGLTPLDLCLYLGHGMRTYELIKLLKGPPTSRSSS